MNILRRFEVWIFLILLVFTNAIFVTMVVKDVLPDSVYNYGRFILLGGVLFGIVYLSKGSQGVRDILTPLLEWKRPLWVYVLAATGSSVICLAVLTGKGIVTGNMLHWRDLIPGIKMVANPISIKMILFSSFVGEIVWISYALKNLTKQFSHYFSSLIIGFFWTLWWLPMAIFDYGIINNLPIAALLINQTGVALTCSFVYLHTRSGLLVLVMQIIFNGTILIFPVTPDAGGVATYWAFSITYFSLASLLHVIFKKPMGNLGLPSLHKV